MPLQFIKLEVSDFIAKVVMDRPPVNAQNSQLRAEIMEVFDSFNDRDDVRVAILTGAGKVFSAGADIKERAGVVKQPGDTVRITIQEDLDPRQLEIPEELSAVLEANAAAKAAFEQLSYTHRREHVLYIQEAKKEETRRSRAQKTVERLLK